MKEVSEITVCIVNNGLHLPVAFRMAEQAKRVIWTPASWERGFCSMRDACIGSGFEQIEHCLDFWDILDEIDLFMFPDVGMSGLQLHLESIGKKVWGSRKGDSIEHAREKFMRLLGEIGLEVPPFTVKVGMGDLRDYLRDAQDKYIKISRWRGDMETQHWRNWVMDEGWLDCLAVDLGPFKTSTRFLVFDKIDTKIEIGGDTICVDGQWPSLMLNGFEWKDCTYLSAVTKRDDMPDQTQEIIEAITPFMAENHYRNQVSFEVRVKDDHFYYIDATQRGGMPSTASQLTTWTNFAEMVWVGAHGEMVEPETDTSFTIECALKSKSHCKSWDSVQFEEDLMPHLKLSYCCFKDGGYRFPPDEMHQGDLGWLVTKGDSPREALDLAKEYADMLPDGIDANVENLTGLIQEIEEAESDGIPFSDKELPEPAEVIE